MQFLFNHGGFYIREGMAPMILLDQPWRLDIVSRFPGVVTLWVSHPFYEIL